MKQRITIILIIIMLSASIYTIPSSAQTIDQVTVLIDETHLERYSFDSNFTKAINALNLSTHFLVKIMDDGEINNDTLNNVDILMMTSPQEALSSNESYAIQQFLSKGGRLFLSTDPQIGQNTTYEHTLGNPEVFQQILDALNITQIKISMDIKKDNVTNEITNIYGDSMLDIDHAVDENHTYLIRLDASTFIPDHTITQGISEVYTITATFKPTNTSFAIGRGYNSSFAQYVEDGNYRNATYPNMSFQKYYELLNETGFPPYSAINGTRPPWLIGLQMNQSKIAIVGSTIMFSDMMCEILNTTWFDTANNAQLFMNIMEWLGGDLIEVPTIIPYVTGFSLITLVIGLVVYLKGRKEE